MTTHNTYTLGRVIPAAGTGYSQLPGLFNESWLTNLVKDYDKAFDFPDATYPYNIVSETDNNGYPLAYFIEVALAGISKDDIEVTIEGGKLRIRVGWATWDDPSLTKEPDPETVTYLRRGISKRRSNMLFTLKNNMDVKNVSSTYTDGLLRVKVPVVKPETHSISIKVD